MRALILGARGAVGSATADALRSNGHTVIGAGRRAAPETLVCDVTTAAGQNALRAEAQHVDVIIDASGQENPVVQYAAGTTPVVDVSATARHLDHLSTHVPDGGTVLAGAGIAPGLSTVLIHELDAVAGDEIDVAVMLGGGETHGAAAVDWTERLAGSPIYAGPETTPAMNLRTQRRLPFSDGRVRTHLRADFPDDLLIGRPNKLIVRSWLALDTRFATSALTLVGKFPSLAPLLRYAPHVGSEAWSVTAQIRGSERRLVASGLRQSLATGRLAALAAEQLVTTAPSGAVTMADIVSLDQIRRTAGITVAG